MKLLETIHADYVTAMKEKNVAAKSALSSVKSEITKAQKSGDSFGSTDDEILKIINKSIKTRMESIKMYKSANRIDLAEVEEAEVKVLKTYMPPMMTESEIAKELTLILEEVSKTVNNPRALEGKTIGEFNKRFNGRADIGTIRMILNNLI